MNSIITFCAAACVLALGVARPAMAVCGATTVTSSLQIQTATSNPEIALSVMDSQPVANGTALKFTLTIRNNSAGRIYTVEPSGQPCDDSLFAPGNVVAPPVATKGLGEFLDWVVISPWTSAIKMNQDGKLALFYILPPQQQVTIPNVTMKKDKQLFMCAYGVNHLYTLTLMTVDVFTKTFLGEPFGAGSTKLQNSATSVVETAKVLRDFAKLLMETKPGEKLKNKSIKGIAAALKSSGILSNKSKTTQVIGFIVDFANVLYEFYDLFGAGAKIISLPSKWSPAGGEVMDPEFDKFAEKAVSAAESLSKLVASAASNGYIAKIIPGLSLKESALLAKDSKATGKAFSALGKKLRLITFLKSVAEMVTGVLRDYMTGDLSIATIVAIKPIPIQPSLRIVRPQTDVVIPGSSMTLQLLVEPLCAESIGAVEVQVVGPSKTIVAKPDKAGKVSVNTGGLGYGKITVFATAKSSAGFGTKPADAEPLVVFLGSNGVSQSAPDVRVVKAPDETFLKAGTSKKVTWRVMNIGKTPCTLTSSSIQPAEPDGAVVSAKLSKTPAPLQQGSPVKLEVELSTNHKYALAKDSVPFLLVSQDGTVCGTVTQALSITASAVLPQVFDSVLIPGNSFTSTQAVALPPQKYITFGQYEDVRIRLAFDNTGSATWVCSATDEDGVVLKATDSSGGPKESPLATSDWSDNMTAGSCSGGQVPAGDQAVFEAPIKTPVQPGSHVQFFRLFTTSGIPVSKAVPFSLTVTGITLGATGVSGASIASPNGGEAFTAGETVPVAFSIQGVKNLTVGYLMFSPTSSGSDTVLVAQTKTLGTQVVQWKVPSITTSNARFYLSVDVGGYPPATAWSDQPFSIAPACTPAGAVDIYSPGSLIVLPNITIFCSKAVNAIGYEFEMAANAGFVGANKYNSVAHLVEVSGVTTGTMFFRARALGVCANGPWSDPVAVPAKINQSPTTPTSPSPPNGAQGVTIAKALSWQGGDSDGGTVQYQVWMGSAPNNLELALGWMDDKTSYIPQPPLLPGKTYYWQVKTKDDGNLVTAGPVWSFTTANEMADVAVTIDEVTGTYKPQSSLTIKWTAKNTGSFPSKGALAKLYLSKAQGQKQQALNADWLPVPPLAPGESKTVFTPVKIAAIDAGAAWIDLWADTATFYSDANLANHLASAAVSYKDEVKPTITQITVVGSNVCYAGVPNCFQKAGENIHFVAVSKDDTGVATMDVEWSADGASGWTSIVQGCKPGSSGYQDACSWKPPLSFVKSKVWFRISVADSAGNTTSSVFGPVAVIDGSGPVIAFGKPATGASYKLGDTVDVAWSASSPNGVKKVSLSLLTDAAQQCNCNLDTVFSEQPDPSKAAFKIPMSAAYVSKAARFRLTVWDNFGASTKVMSEPFQIADASFPVAPWSLPVAVSGSGTPGRPVCSLAPDGNIRLVYRSTEGGYASGPIAMRTINGGQLGAIETVGTAAATVAQHMATATSPDGKTVIAWSEDDKAVRIVEGTPGAWSNKVTPSPLGVSLAVWPTAAAGVNGRMVCWSDFSKAVFCAHSSNFGVGVKILDDTTYPNLLATKDGKFLLVATGALSQQLKIARLDGTQILSSVALAKGPYDFWRAAIGEDGSEVLARPENNTGEAKGVYFHPLLGDKLGAQEVAKYAVDGGVSLALSSDALGRWIQFARSGEAGQAKLVVSTTRLASGWSVPAPIVPATLAGAGDYPPAVCRGKDGRLHLFFDANGAIQYTHALHQLDTAPPELDWLSPASDAELVIGQAAPLSWSSKDESGVASVKIEWSKTGTTGPWSTVGDKLEAASSLDWPVPALPKTQVHFRLTATDSLGQSAIKVRGPCLIVDKAPPAVAISAPLAGEKLVGGSEVALMWTAKDNVGVVLVDVSMSTDGGLSWKKIAEALAEDVALKVTLPKIDAKDLRLRVSATDAAGLVGSATVGPMALEVANTPPVAAYAPSPVDGAVDVGAAGLALAWLSGDPDVDTTLTYDIWLGAAGGELVKVKAGVTEPQFAPPGLQPGTKYQWRITASDGKATVDGPVWTFTTLVPPPAGLDALTVLGTTAATVTLTWTGPAEGIVSIERSLEGAEQYAEVGTSAAKDGAWTDKAAAAHTTYVYRARRKAGLAWSNYTPPAQATTANTAPSTPLLVAPALNATGLPPKQVTLSWQATDADGDPLAVDVYLGTNAQPTLLAAEVTGTSLVLDELAYSSVYFWRIVVTDPAGGTAQSSMSTFITAPPPLPEAPSKLTAKLVDDITLELTWDDNSTVENGFRVELEGAKGWETIATTAWSATTVNPVAGAPTMTLRVVAFNESGDSAASNSVTVKLNVAPPGSDAGSGDVAGAADAGGWDSTPGPDAGGLSDLDTPGDASGDLGSDLAVPPEDGSKSDLAATADGAVPGADVAASADAAEVSTCSSDANCDDGDPCTKDNCIAGACGHAAVFGCCKSDSACKSGQGCVSGVCKAVALCSACKVDADCGTTHAKCVDFGAEGSGCLPVCAGAKVCGPGTQCEKLGSLEVCVPKTATCKCAPTEEWTCSADGKTKVLLDACKGIVKGTDVACSAGCVAGACVDAADSTAADDTLDIVAMDADTGPKPPAVASQGKDDSGCRAGSSAGALSGAWILLLACLAVVRRRKVVK